MGWGLTVVSFVNLCHGLVTVGQAVVAWLWGEGHGAALLFWCERSRGWGKWGCAVGDSLGWGRGAGLGDRGGQGRWWWLVASHPPPNLPPGRGEGLNWGGGLAGAIRACRAGGGGSGPLTPLLTSPLEGERD